MTGLFGRSRRFRTLVIICLLAETCYIAFGIVFPVQFIAAGDWFISLGETVLNGFGLIGEAILSSWMNILLVALIPANVFVVYLILFPLLEIHVKFGRIVCRFRGHKFRQIRFPHTERFCTRCRITFNQFQGRSSKTACESCGKHLKNSVYCTANICPDCCEKGRCHLLTDCRVGRKDPYSYIETEDPFISLEIAASREAGSRRVFAFPNGWQASVVTSPLLHIFPYYSEIGILDSRGRIRYDDENEGDVIITKSREEEENVLRRIMNLPKTPPDRGWERLRYWIGDRIDRGMTNCRFPLGLALWMKDSKGYSRRILSKFVDLRLFCGNIRLLKLSFAEKMKKRKRTSFLKKAFRS